MNMEIEYALKNFKIASKVIVYNGSLIPKDKLKIILNEAFKAGYKTIMEIPDSLIEKHL